MRNPIHLPQPAEILARYDRVIRLLCDRATRRYGKAVVEDVIQDTFLCLMERLKDRNEPFATSDQTPPNWFFRMVKQCIGAAKSRYQRQLDKEKRNVGNVNMIENDSQDETLQQLDDAWKKQILLKCLDRLPVRQKDVIAYRLKGLLNREIAEKWGVGESAVSKRIKTATENLRKCVSREMQFFND